MQPQPPAEADIIAATDSLRLQKDAVDGQIVSLLEIAQILERIKEDPRDVGDGLARPIAGFVRAYVAGLHQTTGALDAQIEHNERVLQAVRSSILVPGLGVTRRKPSS